MNKLFKYILFFFIIGSFVFSFKLCLAEEEFEDVQGYKWKTPLETIGEEADYKVGAETPSVTLVIAQIIQAILSLLGVIFVILMIYAGYLWMTAGGNEEQLSKAKKIIIDAFIGVVIVVAAYAITYFVVENLTKATQEKEGESWGVHWEGLN